MPTLKQQNQNSALGAASISVAFNSNVSAGNLLVAIGSNDGVNSAPTTLTDTQGNVWTPVASATAVDGFASIHMFFVSAGASGPNTVQWSGGGAGGDLMLQIMEYPLTGAAVDVSTGFGGASPTVTTAAQPIELVIAAVLNQGVATGAVGGWAVTNGFTVQQFVQSNNAGIPLFSGTAVADFTTAATGPVATTFTSVPTGTFLGLMAAFTGSAPAPAFTKLEISLFGTKRVGKLAAPECTEHQEPEPAKLFQADPVKLSGA